METLLIYRTIVISLAGGSLVPRLLHSGTQTLKLCRQGKLGIYSHMSSIKGRWGRVANHAWAYPKTQNKKKREGSGIFTTHI